MSSSLDLLAEIENLMRLNGDNPFKVRAFEKAQQALVGVDDLETRARAGTLTEIDGIGKGISEVLTEFLLKGKSTVRDELKAALPQGLLELTQVEGLGPKKAKQLIEELGITTLGELEYACKENRLLNLKGFGGSTQTKILKSLEEIKSRQGRALLCDALELSRSFLEGFRKKSKVRIEETGLLRRRMEVVDGLDYLIEGEEKNFKAPKDLSLPVRFHFATSTNFGSKWIETSASPEYFKALGDVKPAPNEEKVYESLKIEWTAPELRETVTAVHLAKDHALSKLLKPEQVKGIFHNHTQASDGRATLEQMVKRAQELGYEYIGISDHSQSAFYAQGLKAEALKLQEKEIKDLQEKYPDIRIFWGVESDILQSGELDYPESQLKRFDFVIASVHSRFKMDRKQMTERLLCAAKSPYTTMMGHLTGRLLLGREPYDFDMEAVIEECGERGVVIEINANPQRLDIDWRNGPSLIKNKTLVCINPDAHDLEGLEHTAYGVTVARKALLPASQVLNTKSRQEIEKWLKDRRA